MTRPSFRSSIDLSFTEDIVNLLAQKADIAFRMGDLPDSALTARKLGESARVIVASPAYLARRGMPEVPAALRDHDCITFNFRRSRIGWPFRQEGTLVEVPISGPVQVNNGETLRQMALAGVGLARLGRWHVTDDIARGTLVPVLETFNAGDREAVHAIHLGGAQVPRRVRTFIEHMVKVVEAAGLFG
ncbi:hypothetical protein ACELLULO517_18895 [Acidisoma cellulosilytica]|uniref:LysR substrate-binding domain-containing protein n=1 Tax=Acidisoma cellulosilyticum TaxID=2802395 RepID=A0A963Z5R6_9PROT|nr:LysR substrate-binding domain-containing protein [Acidisoma cellulosilyticum]MCB8882323.1 hypothetical protein [Acidisoma cellulosilyticum]